eukprot:6761439-Prymnesium_polylepis.2
MANARTAGHGGARGRGDEGVHQVMKCAPQERAAGPSLAVGGILMGCGWVRLSGRGAWLQDAQGASA